MSVFLYINYSKYPSKLENCNEKVSINVGFYYMANAARRLVGTLLSGLLFMIGRNPSIGLQYCLNFLLI